MGRGQFEGTEVIKAELQQHLGEPFPYQNWPLLGCQTFGPDCGMGGVLCCAEMQTTQALIGGTACQITVVKIIVVLNRTPTLQPMAEFF